jgi:hypothetical protein
MEAWLKEARCSNFWEEIKDLPVDTIYSYREEQLERIAGSIAKGAGFYNWLHPEPQAQAPAQGIHRFFPSIFGLTSSEMYPLSSLKFEKIELERDEWFKSEGFEFSELVERDSQQKELVGLMQSNLDSFREGRYNNQSWTLLTIFGVSGSGKTRLSFEVVENLRSAIIDCSPKQTFKFVDIFVKFTNGDKPDPIAKG